MIIHRKVINVDYGLSSAYSNGIIEINRKINGNLRKKILKHEFRHTLSDSYTKKDYINDYNSSNPYFIESLIFSLKNPECLINFFPFMYSYYQKRWTYNITSLFPIVFYGLIFGSFSSLLFKANFFYAYLGFFNLMIIFNMILLVYTHFYVKSKALN